MPKDDSRSSLTPAPSRTRMKLEAYTDWLVAIAITGLTAMDKVPWEVGVGVLTLIAGISGILKNRKGGGTAAGILLLVLKKVGIGIGLSALLFGCSPALTKAVVDYAPIAAKLLKEIATKHDETVNEAEAACFPLPDEFQLEDGAVYAMCRAPVIEE